MFSPTVRHRCWKVGVEPVKWMPARSGCALHFLEENDVGAERAQPVAQLVYHEPPVEEREPLVDVVGDDVQAAVRGLHVRHAPALRRTSPRRETVRTPRACGRARCARARLRAPGTLIWFTTLPSTRFSRLQARCCGSMRAIVEHMHTVGAMNCTTLPCGLHSSARRLTRFNSVPTSQRVPGRARRDRLDDEVGRADVIRELAYLEVALGMADHHAARVLLAPAQHVLRLEHLVHRAMPFPQQDLAPS